MRYAIEHNEKFLQLKRGYGGVRRVWGDLQDATTWASIGAARNAANLATRGWVRIWGVKTTLMDSIHDHKARRPG